MTIGYKIPISATARDASISREKIKVYISSHITDLTDASNDQKVEFCTDGELTVKGNTYEITYKENESLGMADIESTLRFKTTRPQIVNLIRRGSAPASLIFDTDVPRRNCTYCLGNLPFDFCICTNSVTNVFDGSSGKLVLDYEIEFNGIKSEHNIFSLEYKR